MITLLQKEQAVLQVIQRTWQEYRDIPTVMEIVRQTEKSYMDVYRILMVLKNIGFIDMRNTAGAVIITPLWWE